MSAPFPGSGSGVAGGLWFKVDDVNMIGNVVKIRLNSGAFTISFFSLDLTTAAFTTAAYADLPTAQAKFDNIQKLIQGSYTLIDIS